MNCERIQEHLADYLDGGLEAKLVEEFNDHTKHCEACRDEVQSLSAALETLTKLEVPPLATPVQQMRRSNWSQLLAYAAVLLIGLGLGWSAKPESGTSPASPFTPAQLDRVAPGVHRAWVKAALASSATAADVSPFARNTVRLVRALSGGQPSRRRPE